LIFTAVLLGIICEKVFSNLSESKMVLYSDNLKLSVDAKVAEFQSILTRIQAKVGLIFHSADEKRVLSIDFLTIFHFNFKLISSLIHGITGNSEASIHFIFVFQLWDTI
jgi:hypothetical protein